MTEESPPVDGGETAAPDYGRVRPWTLILVLPVSLLPVVVILIAIPKQDRALRSLWESYSTVALMGAWSWIQIRRAHGSIRDLVGRGPSRRSEYGQILLALPAAGLAAGFFWLTYCPLKLLGLDVDLERLSVLKQFAGLGSAGRVMEILLIVCFVPIVEECVYRGLLLRAWSRRLGLVRGLVYTSLLFGVGHANPLGIAVVGLVLAMLCVSSRTLIIPIGCHALNNAIAMLMWRRHWLGNVSLKDLAAGRVAVPLALISAGILAWWYHAGPGERLRQAKALSPRPRTA